MKQIEMNFNKEHEAENNTESDNMYLDGLDHFNHQCRIVYETLLTGRKLTFRDALIYLGIGDLRRRCKDLKDLYKIPVKDRYIEGTRFKEWYLEKDYINQFFKNI